MKRRKGHFSSPLVSIAYKARFLRKMRKGDGGGGPHVERVTMTDKKSAGNRKRAVHSQIMKKINPAKLDGPGSGAGLRDFQYGAVGERLRKKYEAEKAKAEKKDKPKKRTSRKIRLWGAGAGLGGVRRPGLMMRKRDTEGRNMDHDELKSQARDQVTRGQNIDQRIQFLQVESLDALKDTLSALNRSFDTYAKSQDRLSSRILCLNWVLGILTAVGAIAGLIAILN